VKEVRAHQVMEMRLNADIVILMKATNMVLAAERTSETVVETQDTENTAL
jgi:hypothetical protein